MAEEREPICGRFRVSRRVDTTEAIRRSIGQDIVSGRVVEIWSAPSQLISEEQFTQLGQIAFVCTREIEKTAADHEPLTATCRQNGQTHLILPVLEGESLAERLSQAPLSEVESLHAALDLLATLDVLHKMGLVHGDLRPSRVHISKAQKRNKFHLMPGLPEGLHALVLIESRSGSVQIENAQYLAPERVQGDGRDLVGRPTAQSDLFSFGALLFECLVGEPLFANPARIGDYFQGLKLPSFEPRLSPGTSPSLLRILYHLLEPDPNQRYQSAEGVQADIAVLLHALETNSEPNLVVGTSDIRNSLTEPAFINRVKEIEAFQAAQLQAGSGLGRLLIVEGSSGSGKTRLLDEFARQARQMGRLVLRGGAEIEIARRPFQALSGLTESLLEADESDPGFGKRLREYLDYHSETLRRVLPELRPLLREAAEETIESRRELEQFAQTRTLTALSELFNGLGTRDRPAVLLIDDFQWADALTIDLLSFWQNRLSNLPHPLVPKGEQFVLIVIAFRTEEVPTHHPLRRLQSEALTLTLSPLTAGHIQSLALSMAGRNLPPEVITRVQQIAAGNPFTAHAFLHGLLESGFLVSASDTWRIKDEAKETVVASSEAATFLSERFRLLAPRTLRVMSYAAVLGKKFDLALLARLVSLSEEETRRSLDEAVLRRMVLIEKQNGIFFHDRIRETVLHQVSEAERQSLHAKAADILVATGSRDSFAIAYHYDRAGRARDAAPYAAAAARIARSQNNLPVAEENLRIALRGLAAAQGEAPGEVSPLALYRELGEVLSLEGKYDEAHIYFQHALEQNQTTKERAQLQGLVAETFFRQGKIEMATTILRQALRLLGLWVPESNLGFRVGIEWERFVHDLHKWLPFFFVERRPLPDDDRDIRAVDLLHKFSLAHLFKGIWGAIWAEYRAMNLIERYPPVPARAYAYGYHGYALSLFNDYEGARVYLERSIQMHHSMREVSGEASDRAGAAAVYYAAGQLDEALKNAEIVMRLLERAGNRQRYNDIHLIIPFVHLRRGEMVRAVEEAQRIYADGTVIGDTHASGMAIGIWAKATGGKVPLEMIERELASAPDDLFTQCEIHQAHALALMREERFQEAAETLEMAVANIEANHLWVEYATPVYLFLSETYRHLATRSRLWEFKLRSQYLNRAEQCARRGLKMARGFSNNLPHAYRELAILAATRKRGATARRYLEKSLSEANARGFQAEFAHSLWIKGQIGPLFDWPESEVASQTACEQLKRCHAEFLIEREATGSLATVAADPSVDPKGVLAPLLSADTLERTLSATKTAARQVLSADWVLLLSPEPSAPPSTDFSGHYEAARPFVKPGLVQRVLAMKQIQIAAIPESETSSDFNLRIHMGAPLFIEGEPVAVLYIILDPDSSQNPGRSARDLDFIVHLAELKLATKFRRGPRRALESLVLVNVDESAQGD